MIGILGGMGPQAGVDLASKIIANTLAQKDQDHLPLLLMGDPGVPDRTDFLFGRTDINPAIAMAESAHILALAGATCMGIACNTAHSPPIFEKFEHIVRSQHPDLHILHLIQETVAGIQLHFPDAKRVGILATEGSYRFNLYNDPLNASGLTPLIPRNTASLTSAIFDSTVGIKACSAPVSHRARSWILESIDCLIDQGAQVVILGCTELPLAVPETTVRDVPLIDPGTMLARALISATQPDRLAPWRVATKTTQST